jgi:hypothetical protein
MGTVLHLGMLDVPYADEEGATTGDVAEWLETKFNIMSIYAELNLQQIGDDLAEGALEALESIMMGAPATDDPLLGATSKIEEGFKEFISSGEMEKLGYPGVPTKAAQRGVNHRMKHPYAKRDPRPSFVDTGLYVANFKAWIEDDPFGFKAFGNAMGSATSGLWGDA